MPQLDKRRLKKWAIFLIVGCCMVAAGISGYKWERVRENAEHLEEEAKAGPHVQFAIVKKGSAEHTLTLVGEARPYASVTLYAKVSGYLKDVAVDKGDRVTKDQTLAVIESPEIDKDYQGAAADAKNKKAIADRMNKLRSRNLVSPQEADQAISDSKVAAAKLGSLAVQKSYEILKAPFEGTVTARYADAGALMQNAANSQTSALPVVTVSQVDRLRVYVYVDQKDAAFIKIGSPAKVSLTERPDLEMDAQVSRVSGELDPKTKMLLTEIDLDNKDGRLVPGSFVQVNLKVQTPAYLEIPAQALVLDQGKTEAVVIGAEDKVHYQEIKIGDNDGRTVTVYSGLQDGDRVALNVGTKLQDGNHVRLVDSNAKPENADAKK